MSTHVRSSICKMTIPSVSYHTKGKQEHINKQIFKIPRQHVTTRRFSPGCVASLTSPTKGDVRLVGLPSTLRYEVGSTATYSCDQGYTLVGGTNPRQCEIDSTWSGDAPTCEPISMYDINRLLNDK